MKQFISSYIGHTILNLIGISLMLYAIPLPIVFAKREGGLIGLALFVIAYVVAGVVLFANSRLHKQCKHLDDLDVMYDDVASVTPKHIKIFSIVSICLVITSAIIIVGSAVSVGSQYPAADAYLKSTQNATDSQLTLIHSFPSWITGTALHSAQMLSDISVAQAQGQEFTLEQVLDMQDEFNSQQNSAIGLGIFVTILTVCASFCVHVVWRSVSFTKLYEVLLNEET